jgi:hypothetical protein
MAAICNHIRSAGTQLLRKDRSLGVLTAELPVSLPKGALFGIAARSLIVIGCYGSWSNCTLRSDRDFGRALFEVVPYLCSSC